MHRRIPGGSLAASLMLAACVSSAHGPDDRDSASAPAGAVASVVPLPVAAPRAPDRSAVASPPAGDTASADRATIARLEREARAIAKTAGCTSASACRAAPVGAKACGGPRTYIVYCASSTDTVALQRTLRELARVEKRYNERSGTMSTCEMRLPPVTELVGGACREKSEGNRVP